MIAETAAQARDAAEAVGFDIDPLPAVTRASAAAAPDAPQLYDDVPGNLVLDYHFGNTEAVAAAFAKAAHVTRLELTNNRLVPTPLDRINVGDELMVVVPSALRAQTEKRFHEVGRHGRLARWLRG